MQRTHGNDEKREADVVECEEIFLIGLGVGRIFNEPLREKEGQDADGNIDIEDPVPRVVVGNPSAERWADGGRENCDQSIERESEAALRRLERIRHDGLRHWLQAATAEALEDAKEQKQSEGGSNAAKKRTDGKNDNAEHEEILAADDAGGPSTHGKDNCVGNKIRGENPGAFVETSAEASGDVRQGQRWRCWYRGPP